jgi:hypothetical protein
VAKYSVARDRTTSFLPFMISDRISVSTRASGTEPSQRIALPSLHRACGDLVHQLRLVAEAADQGRRRRLFLVLTRKVVDDELDKTELLAPRQCPRLLGQIVSSSAHDEQG